MSSFYHYYSFGLSGYIDRLLLRIRRGVYELFVAAFQPTPRDIILDVGISENDHISSNYLERTYTPHQAIIGLSVEPHPSLRTDYPELTLVCGDGRALPLKNNAVDYVHSHAVIEHVGSRANQLKFLQEALRVARKGVLITTPNRWHPLETHTGLPFLHYLPAAVWRPIYRMLGKHMYATEETLNLFTPRELETLTRACATRFELHRLRWLGIASNLVLVIRKEADPPLPYGRGAD